jgi:peptidyl-tRNA hydrolase
VCLSSQAPIAPRGIVALSITPIEEEHHMSKAIIGLALSLAQMSMAMAQTPNTTEKCGLPEWSIAEQRQVVVPCTAPAPTVKANGDKQSCGVPEWSIADQRQTVLPCVNPTAAQSLTPHIGE